MRKIDKINKKIEKDVEKKIYIITNKQNGKVIIITKYDKRGTWVFARVQFIEDDCIITGNDFIHN